MSASPAIRAMALALVTMSSPTMAQTAADDQYRPLFTEDMIQRASPEQGERMRATEARNRQAFEDRQAALRARQAEQQQAREQAATPPTPSRGRSKIYRWVDANGRVYFGDAPQGNGAQEVKVGGAARTKGTPAPASPEKPQVD